jgi:uncharacterized protein with HEPN domain/predicted nucleotidyltransferase
MMAQVVQKADAETLRVRIRATPGQIAAFCRAYHIRWLARFGSVLRDDFSDTSDIDMLYMREPKASSMDELVEMKEALSVLTGGREVDFIAATNLRWRIRDRVFAETETLYGDPPEEVIVARAKRSAFEQGIVKDENLYIGDMLDIAHRAQRIAAGRTREELDTDELFQLAELHRVQTIGEAATHVSHTTRAIHPSIPWVKIVNMRNVLVHRDAGRAIAYG